MTDSQGLVEKLIGKYKNKDYAKRYGLFPIQDEVGYKLYKTQEIALWSSNELEFTKDLKDYQALSEKSDNLQIMKQNKALKKMLDLVLCFFAATDGVVVDNIALRFLLECSTLEEQGFYLAQMFIEFVHAETYSLIINTLIVDPTERNKMFESVNNLPCVRNKAEWLDENIGSDKSLSHRLLVLACGEGIFFTSSFLFIFYFRSKGIFQNIIFANEQISKDENMHRDNGILRHKRAGLLPVDEAHTLVNTAVELEFGFVDEVLPESIEDLGIEDSKNYVRVLADHLLLSAGYPKLYNTSLSTLPSWMNDIAMEQKANFYEVRVGNYVQSSLKNALDWKGRIAGHENEKEAAYADPRSIYI